MLDEYWIISIYIFGYSFLAFCFLLYIMLEIEKLHKSLNPKVPTIENANK